MPRRSRTLVPGPVGAVLRAGAFAAALAGSGLTHHRAHARQAPLSPVFVDDSPRAADAIVRAGELAAIGNLEEATAVLQSLLDNEPERMIAAPDDPDLFTTVRARVIQMLLSSPALLERYRAVQSDAAQRILDEQDEARAERTRPLTPAGYEAALRIAQRRLENAQFDAALIMLASLDSHPDRTGDGARDAASLLEQIAALAPDATTAERAEALAARWELNPPQPADKPDIPRDLDVFDPLPPASVEGLLSRPLWSDTLGEPLPVTESAVNQRSGTDFPENARWLFATPVVVGDTVYVSDSQTISAWNRFTLSERWRARFEGVQGRTYSIGSQAGFEELTQPAADGRTVAAVMGLAIQGNFAIRRTLVALEASSGQIRWTRELSDLDPRESNQAALVGPVLLDQDVVVVGVRRNDQGRRLDGHSVMGVDATTGSLLWTTSLASAGSLAYGVSLNIADAPRVHEGYVYLTSSVGFAAAFESVSGRVRWIRRLPAGTITQGRADEPWESNTPVLLGANLYLVHPARNEILALDADTGAVIQRMPATKMDNPSYLLTARGQLLGVSSASIVSTDPAQFGPAAPTARIARFTSQRLRGRALVAGERVVAPVIDGVEFYDPLAGGVEPVARIALTKPGNVLPIQSQLLVVDDREIHTYLLWEEARRMLLAQMESSPTDPAPAITYAELAYRAGVPDMIVAAVDAALRAIEADPLRTTNVQHQSRLFRALFEMVEPAAGSLAAPIPAELRGDLIERLGRCASTQSEQVAHLLAAGRFFDAAAQPDRAVESYQRVLDSTELAQTTFSKDNTTVSAEFEATQRLRRAISTHGAAIYAPYQADASRLLADAMPSLDPEPFERIARRYPVAPAAVDAWIQAASRHNAQGRPKLASQALEEGLVAARSALAPQDPRQGELAGRLTRHLIDTGLLHPARDTLEAFLRDNPSAALTFEGRRLEASELLAQVQQSLARLDRRPALGSSPAQHMQMLGWSLLEPIARDAPPMVSDRVMMVSDKNEVAMWASRGPGPLVRLWDAQPGESLVAMDDVGVLTAVARGANDAADFEFNRRDINTGRLLWSTPPFRTLLDPGPLDELLAAAEHPIAPRIETPLSAATPVTALTISFDRRTLVLMDKIGRAAAFDLESGKLLWRNNGLIPRVHAVALEAGTLMVAGADGPVDFTNPTFDAHAGDRMPAVALVIDARSGQVVSRWSGEGSVRWARLSPEGFPVIGLDLGVISLDPYRGSVRWHAAGKDLRSTLLGWTLPGRVIVRDEGDRLWQINSADGSVAPKPLDTMGRMNDGFGDVDVFELDGRTAVRTRLGLALLDARGDPQGADTRGDESPLSMFVLGRDIAATLSLEGGLDDVSQARYALNFYELSSLKAVGGAEVLLPANADVAQCAAVDGKILVTTGAVVTVIDVP